MAQRQRIFIAHSGKFLGSAIWSMLVPEPEFEIVGMANSLEEAVNMVNLVSADVVLIDLSDAEVLGLQTIRALRTINPSIPIITFIPVWSYEYTERALEAGATTCLTESDLAGALLQKLQNLLPAHPIIKLPDFGVVCLPNH
ncbi:MAG: response regulator [Chloroflexota bacterium]